MRRYGREEILTKKRKLGRSDVDTSFALIETVEEENRLKKSCARSGKPSRRRFKSEEIEILSATGWL